MRVRLWIGPPTLTNSHQITEVAETRREETASGA